MKKKLTMKTEQNDRDESDFWFDKKKIKNKYISFCFLRVVQVAWWWWFWWWRGRCCWWSIGSSESSSSISHDMSLSSSSSSPILCWPIIVCWDCWPWWWWLLPLPPPPEEDAPPPLLPPPLDLFLLLGLPSGGWSSGPSSPSCWTLLCFVLRFWNQTLT